MQATTRNRRLSLVMTLVTTGALLLATGAALAQDAGADAPDPNPRRERLAHLLDLTDAQQTQVTQIQDEGHAKRLALRKQLLRLKNELQGEMLRDEPAVAKVNELAEQMGALRTEMQKQRLQQRLAVRRVLTAEQRDKMLVVGEGRDHHGSARTRRPRRRPRIGRRLRSRLPRRRGRRL